MKNKVLKIETMKAWKEYIKDGNPYIAKGTVKKKLNSLKDLKVVKEDMDEEV